jgi:hypothetical protein
VDLVGADGVAVEVADGLHLHIGISIHNVCVEKISSCGHRRTNGQRQQTVSGRRSPIQMVPDRAVPCPLHGYLGKQQA